MRIHINYLTHTLVYSSDGVYLGQYQPNCMDDDFEAPAELWFGAELVGGAPSVDGKPIPNLTPEEIALYSRA